MQAATLLDAFSRLDDPRCRRGVRHPFAGMVVLMLLGMLARIREMEVLVRWAGVHWDQLREPLGFDRDEPPCATTISRTLAQCRVAEFQAALAIWLRACVAEQLTEGVIAVDGKTAKQGLDDAGSPLHMLNVFMHDLQAVIGQWSTGAEKTNEPTLLRRHLAELLDAYPMLRLLTGDAIYAQRPLAELVCGHGRDYLLQVKANQGDTLDALQNCFAQAAQHALAAHSTDQRGLWKKRAGYGSISRTLTISAKRSTCPAAA
jgi:DDE_Tnp_1-associated/Transposase DDE domain